MGTLTRGDGAPAWVQHVMERGLSPTSAASLPVHPSQLYEVLLGVILVGACFAARTRQRFRGQMFLQFVLLYGACRFALDVLRDDGAGGSVGPTLPEHVLVPAGLVALAAASAVWVMPVIEALSVRRVAQGAVFLSAIVAAVLLRPRPLQASPVALSSTQFLALATGLAAAYAFSRVRRATLADPEAAMAIHLPSPRPSAIDGDTAPRRRAAEEATEEDRAPRIARRPPCGSLCYGWASQPNQRSHR